MVRTHLLRLADGRENQGASKTEQHYWYVEHSKRLHQDPPTARWKRIFWSAGILPSASAAGNRAAVLACIGFDNSVRAPSLHVAPTGSGQARQTPTDGGTPEFVLTFCLRATPRWLTLAASGTV